MKIAVLFDGAGLARLGLERAGHRCTGYELDPIKHYMSKYVGSGNCVLADARDVDLSGYDAVWASPPCQKHSSAKTQGEAVSKYSDGGLLEWSLALKGKVPVLWVENVKPYRKDQQGWGTLWNAAQFLLEPIQNRQRLIGGDYRSPLTFRKFQEYYPEMDICPCITASEYKGCATDKRRASRWYGRCITLSEAAYHQGFVMPSEWANVPYHLTNEHPRAKDGKWRDSHWKEQRYEAIGNGVPVYMAEAFGRAYSADVLYAANYNSPDTPRSGVAVECDIPV